MPPLYLITDRRLCAPRILRDVVDEACAAGVQVVQLREKDLSPRELFSLAQEIKPVLDKHGAQLFINDRADVATAVAATGVHLTANSLTPSAARHCLLPHQLIGVSTHSVEEAVFAERDGAHFLCFGPIFETPSKRPFGPPQGLAKLQAVTRAVSLPVFAIGGITPERVSECLEAGAYGVAIISAILSATNISARVAAFLRELHGVQRQV